MNEHSVKHETCPHCGYESTEFIQFATGEEAAVKTEPKEVDDGLLELRYCNHCESGIEIVLQPTRSRVVPHG